jgi:hypothetical protein
MPAKAASGRGESKGKDGKAGKVGNKESKGAASRNEREVYVEGNLEKRCEGNMLRKWQTRYCVFSSKGLAYFKSRDDYVAKKEAGTLIPVASFKNCAVNGLEIMLHAQDRTLLFRAGRIPCFWTLYEVAFGEDSACIVVPASVRCGVQF